MHSILTDQLVRLTQAQMLEQSERAHRAQQLAREYAELSHPCEASRRPPSTTRPWARVLRLATRRTA